MGLDNIFSLYGMIYCRLQAKNSHHKYNSYFEPTTYFCYSPQACPLHIMMKDQYANYVVQKMIDVAEPTQVRSKSQFRSLCIFMLKSSAWRADQ